MLFTFRQLSTIAEMHWHHHAADARVNFGLTNPLLEFALGTAVVPAQVTLHANLVPAWLRDAGGNVAGIRARSLNPGSHPTSSGGSETRSKAGRVRARHRRRSGATGNIAAFDFRSDRSMVVAPRRLDAMTAFGPRDRRTVGGNPHFPAAT